MFQITEGLFKNCYDSMFMAYDSVKIYILPGSSLDFDALGKLGTSWKVYTCYWK